MAIEVWSDPTPRVALHPLSLPTLGRDADALVAPLTGLSRVRGGTYSPTVGVVRFDDGTTAHTDLIRLNPSIDAYSLDFHGRSPRQLSHYRETRWTDLPSRAGGSPDLLLAILNHSYPHISPRRLTERVRAAGYPISRGQLPVHAIISATQAAIWHVTNGLDLDVRPLDLPVRVASRSADGRTRRQMPSAALDWRAALPAGRTVHLELEMLDAPQLAAYSFEVGAHTGHHPVSVQLEQSADGTDWSVVSRSQVSVSGHHHVRAIRRTLGVGATLSRAGGDVAESGYRHYRLAVTGPADRDGVLDLRDVRLHLSARSRFRNDEDVVHVYDYLLVHTLGRPSRSLPHLVVPDALPARTHDRHRATRVRALVGSRTFGGPDEFTPLIVLTTDAAADRRLPAEPRDLARI